MDALGEPEGAGKRSLKGPGARWSGAAWWIRGGRTYSCCRWPRGAWVSGWVHAWVGGGMSGGGGWVVLAVLGREAGLRHHVVGLLLRRGRSQVQLFRCASDTDIVV